MTATRHLAPGLFKLPAQEVEQLPMFMTAKEIKAEYRPGDWSTAHDRNEHLDDEEWSEKLAEAKRTPVRVNNVGHAHGYQPRPPVRARAPR